MICCTVGREEGSSCLTSNRATYRGLTLALLLAAGVCWIIPGNHDPVVMLALMFTAGTILAGLAWLFSQRPAKREAPDILAERVGTYFESDGLCFAARLSVEDGLCWFNVFCQNRYARPVQGTLYFIPMEGVAKEKGGRHDVEPLMVDVSCDGGEVAVVSFPYPIGAAWQGKIIVYDVMATVNYAQRRGELLRTPQGMPVGEPTTETRELFKDAAWLALGHVRLSRGASCELNLPTGVAESIPPDTSVRNSVLWEWNGSRGGFPVA
jgi:hypothetical protein